MMRCVLSLLFAMTVGTVAFAAEPPANQPPTVATPSTEGFLASVAAGNQFEIDSSKLALERARSAAGPLAPRKTATRGSTPVRTRVPAMTTSTRRRTSTPTSPRTTKR